MTFAENLFLKNNLNWMMVHFDKLSDIIYWVTTLLWSLLSSSFIYVYSWFQSPFLLNISDWHRMNQNSWLLSNHETACPVPLYYTEISNPNHWIFLGEYVGVTQLGYCLHYWNKSLQINRSRWLVILKNYIIVPNHAWEKTL